MDNSCLPFREACSAQADGEDPGIALEALDAHLRRCDGCRAYADDVARLARATRLELIAVVPDQTTAILAAIGHKPDGAIRSWRIALVAVALLQLFTAIPNLFPTSTGEAAHASVHLAAFGIALAGSLLLVAWRPAHAAAVAPVLGLLAVLVVALSGLDVATGRVSAADEVRHGIALIGAVIVWAIGRTEGRTPGRVSGPLPSRS